MTASRGLKSIHRICPDNCLRFANTGENEVAGRADLQVRVTASVRDGAGFSRRNNVLPNRCRRLKPARKNWTGMAEPRPEGPLTRTALQIRFCDGVSSCRSVAPHGCCPFTSTLRPALLAQPDADTQSWFSLTSQRTYLPGEKPEISINAHNVNQLEFRVYRVNNPVKFFSQMQELHNFGGQGPAMPKQAHTWLEKFHAWKRRIWTWIRDFIRGQFSPDSRHRIRLWELGGGEKKQGPRIETFAQCPCSISNKWYRFGSGRSRRTSNGRA